MMKLLEAGESGFHAATGKTHAITANAVIIEIILRLFMISDSFQPY
jgi:hypothetical protein